VKYREAVVSFIDILGFSNMVANLEPQEIAEILEFFRSEYSVKNVTDSEARSGIKRECEVYFFSDSVVRVRWDDPRGEVSFMAETEEVMSLAHMQWQLLKRGVLVRGGVAKGAMYSSAETNTVFGPALVEASAMEKMAVNPRIVISGEVFHQFLCDMFSPPEWIRQDCQGNRWASWPESGLEDEPWWINYLWGPFSDALSTATKARSVFRTPKKRVKRFFAVAVEELAATAESVSARLAEDSFEDTRVKEKTQWLDARLREAAADALVWIDGFNLSRVVRPGPLERLRQCAQGVELDELKRAIPLTIAAPVVSWQE
jgi:hypothetical protein